MTPVRRTVLIQSAAAIAAALGLGACSQPTHPATAPSAETSPAPTVGMPAPVVPGGPPLPPDSALIDVMSRLSDPALPGDQKVLLIEGGTADEAAGLDRFGIALRDSGSLPLTFEARDLAWSQSDPGNVVATVVIRTANPQNGDFTYPMEFARTDDAWQLTRQTADLLLQLGSGEGTEPPATQPPPAPPTTEPPPTPPTPTPTR